MGKSPKTIRGLARMILEELEKGFQPPYGGEEEDIVIQLVARFLKDRKENSNK